MDFIRAGGSSADVEELAATAAFVSPCFNMDSIAMIDIQDSQNLRSGYVAYHPNSDYYLSNLPSNKVAEMQNENQGQEWMQPSVGESFFRKSSVDEVTLLKRLETLVSEVKAKRSNPRNSGRGYTQELQKLPSASYSRTSSCQTFEEEISKRDYAFQICATGTPQVGEMANYPAVDGTKRRRVQDRQFPVQLKAEMMINHGSIVARNTFVNSPLGMQLLSYAEALATDDQRFANFLGRSLGQKANPLGVYEERTVYYFMEALKLRMKGIAPDRSSRLLVCSPDELEKSLGEAQQSLPCWQILSKYTACQMVAASQGAQRLHILDFTLWGDDYWTELIQKVCSRPEGPPSIRFTKLIPKGDGAESHFEQTAYQAGQPILQAAQKMGVSIEFNLIQQSAEKLTMAMLCVRKEEVLIVNASRYLYALSDETVLRSSPRDVVLKNLRKLQPHVLVVNEMYANHKGPFFMRRIRDALEFYASVYEAMEHALPAGNKGRHVFEKVLGQDIINVVACEGMQRVIRPEVPADWLSRMEDAAFAPASTAQGLRQELNAFGKMFSQHYSVVEEDDALVLKWRNRGVCIMSSWRPAG